MLYLFKLNLANPMVKRDIANVHKVHARISEFFDDAPRVLWRLDVGSGQLFIRGGNLVSPPAGRYIVSMEATAESARPVKGQDVEFILKANPTKTIGTQDGSNGQRVPVDPMQWLERKAGLCGFEVVSVKSIDCGYVHGIRGKRRLTFFFADYVGKLLVADADLFAHALSYGIGPAKGYGFGLMLCR